MNSALTHCLPRFHIDVLNSLITFWTNFNSSALVSLRVWSFGTNSIVTFNQLMYPKLLHSLTMVCQTNVRPSPSKSDRCNSFVNTPRRFLKTPFSLRSTASRKLFTFSIALYSNSHFSYPFWDGDHHNEVSLF